uniref:F-box protein At2g39490 n=1 Tax=Erigeron canadensis TaxID=72917 RepID=UPI001CB9BD16|nr:F-box protein At2g39490 [Erigeron canadensis]
MEQRRKNTNDISRSEIDQDYISKLPDEILAKILSIHPLDSGSKAVAHFTRLWSKPLIKHGGREVNVQEFESVISAFIANFDEEHPLKMPRKLEYHFNQGLIVTASIGVNMKLHLDFSKGNQGWEKKFWWDIVLNTMDLAPSSSYSLCIKTLKLTSINYICCEFVSSLISKFRYVENLFIEKCNGLRALRIEGLAKLVRLSVENCVDLKSVYVDALELTSLRNYGFLCWFWFHSYNYLEDVYFDLEGPGSKHLDYRVYYSLLKTMRDVRVLTLHGRMYEEVFGPLLFLEKEFRFSKLEDLWWIDGCMGEDNMNWLFSFLKYCTSLKRLFISIDPQRYSRRKPFTGDHKSSIKVKKSPLRKLKLVKLEGCKSDEEVMFFKEHMMEVFNVEPRVVETREGMQTRCLIRIPKRQTIGKATKSNKLKFCYKFVEELENNIGLCSKHPHMA